MSFISPYMKPARIVSYDKVNRTAQVTIAGLTDGLNEGITAVLAYPIGDDDIDTERELLAGADVWVFFEEGDTTMPVVVFYRRHGKGHAAVDVRRIRQENIELLARANITLEAQDIMNIKARQVNIEANEVNIKADINHVGDYFMAGNQTINGGQIINGNSISYGNQTINGLVISTVDMVAGNISVRYHYHPKVRAGNDVSGKPIN